MFAGIVRRTTQVILPFLMTETPAVLILGLRRPPPPRRSVFRQPGLAACAVATPVLAAVIVGYGLTSAWGAWKAVGGAAVPSLPPTASPIGPVAPPRVRATPIQDLWFGLGFIVANSAYAQNAVAGAWLILALGGWWRPERHWLDRLGRAVGAAWLLLMAAEFVVGG